MSEATEMRETPTLAVPTLTLGWRLQMALDHGDVAVEAIALACGVSRSTVSRWLHDGGKRPRPGDLEVFARECHVPYRWLAPTDDDLDGFIQPTAANVAPKLRAIEGGNAQTGPRTSPMLYAIPHNNLT